ncbi:hypothetical protein D779_3027 [Imhoffiella purpurea]|uniref:Uncharacterized protein n=1 Tax=Imhoffiella purpurea TaxID=1249627 RepID=W9VUL2_9GAMM|nr:hypothetical protein D779_3027 [Imhoffiella purpurea]
MGITLRSDGTQQFGRQAELSKRHENSWVGLPREVHWAGLGDVVRDGYG